MVAEIAVGDSALRFGKGCDVAGLLTFRKAHPPALKNHPNLWHHFSEQA